MIYPLFDMDNEAPQALETCTCCGEPRAQLEMIDGGKVACAGCLNACHYCTKPGSRWVTLAGLPNPPGAPLLIGGEFLVCIDCYVKEIGDDEPDDFWNTGSPSRGGRF